MQYTLYIRKNINERFALEENKSQLINELLDQHYENISVPRVKATKEEAFDIIQKNYIEPNVKETITKVTSRGEALTIKQKLASGALDIPGVEVASEAVCKGTHHMSREDCGKKGCPWK